LLFFISERQTIFTSLDAFIHPNPFKTMSPTTVRTHVLLLVFIFTICFSQPGFAQTNDTTGAPTLTSALSCTIPSSGSPSYSLNGATATSGIPSGCVSGTHYDMWFKFSALSTSETVTIGNFAGTTTITNPEVQIFSAALVSQACGATSATASTFVVGVTYYVRVSNVGSSPNGTGQKPKFDLCLTHTLPPPANDDCSNATTLTYGVAKASETVSWATNSGVAVAPCSGVADDDVWYKFIATSTSANIALSSLGNNLSSSGVNVQVFSGSCGSLTSIGCGTTSVTVNSLTTSPSTTYYVRVYSTGSGNIATAGDFGIIVTDPNALSTTNVTAGRMNEVFKQTVLSGSGALQYPWEITYGPDNMLWITEARGYKVDRMDPNTGAKTTVLDLNSTSPDLTAWGADSLRAVSLTSTSNWNATANNWPQGGLAGLALHPQFLDGTGLHDFVYVSYVHRYLGTVSGSGGIYFRNKIVRFTYNTVTGKLGSPAVVCDTIPGGQDHNSQRMIVAPVGGTYYLFYAAGDMGAGQFSNRLRPENAQHPESYEGKILRFNLESDGESGADGWIPNSNPYNTLLGKQSAVYSIGIRNNQGFAYDTATGNLYGASHGPYSDDEINIIESFRNYGHPLIEGFVDGNYNGNSVQGTPTSYSAGAGYTDNNGVSTCPPIGNEATNKTTIDASGNGLYKDPLFSAYAASAATVANIWTNEVGGNPTSPIPWPTEAWSGLDIYNNTLIPGWKHSLLVASLKLGRLVKLKLGAAGTTTMPGNNASDTITYFNCRNRFRDMAFSPNGKDIYVVMDNSSTTSGPGSANPVVPNCLGCVHKYTFLGYADAGGKSTIPASIDVTDATVNTVDSATQITIDNTNNFLWVPITGPDGNILAEIYPNGNNLGVVRSAFYKHSGAIRISNGVHYLDRNITITPQNQPSTPVKIRLYFSKAEFDVLDADPASGVSAIGSLKILKNSDVCGPAIISNTLEVDPTFAEAHGTAGYMLQGDITSFSSFYFASSNIPLPLNLLTFKGSLKNNATLLEWETSNEMNTSKFAVERSADGRNFKQIGTVTAVGNGGGGNNKYSYTDYDVTRQPSSVVYYRLKIVDIDGSYTYSDIVTITLPLVTSKVALFPNPAAHEVNVTITTTVDGKVKWQLIDHAGRIVAHNSIGVKRGNNNVVISLNRLSSGTYFLIVSGADIDQKIKLEKL
jgi:glucose/arabinose dehydrogenase